MIGAQLSQFRIIAKLGQGGMGEVYRAADTKLGREVAIKVLPPGLTHTRESTARFEREARALATLNHPGIASIHGFDISDGTHFLVMELVEGETLEERLKRGPLPIDEALDIARQIAGGLEAAHECGIIHRDLKPSNVKITPAGRVKLLDFGLAKAVQISSATASVDSPTLIGTVECTTPGLILGTAAYMSPEQARGLEVDKRTDVWAFGCCFYECLTGRRAFRGPTVSDVLAEVLKAAPDWSALPETPPAILTMLRGCLEKEPRRRLSSVGDISILLAETAQVQRDSARILTPPKTGPQHSGRSIQAWWKSALAALFAGAVLAAIVLLPRVRWNPSPATPIRSIAVLPFENLSPDSTLDAVCNGFSDDISMGLKRTGLLDKVPLWGSVKAFRGSVDATPKIASDLGVASLVHGTVKRDGKELKVNADLLDGPTGKALWSESFSTRDGDIGAVQNQVVLGIRKHLRLELSENEKKLRLPGTIKLDAYTAFRNGLEQYDLYTKEGFARAEEHLRRARELDPAFIDPIASLAGVKWLPSALGISGVMPQEGFRQAKEILSHVTEVHARHSSILRVRGWIAMGGVWDWKQAIAHFRAAAAADPEASIVINSLAYYASVVEGRLADALRETERALRLEPGRVQFLDARGRHHEYHGNFEEALSVYQNLQSQHPEHWSSLWAEGKCLAALKRLREAHERLERAVQLSGKNPFALSELALVEAELGNPGRAREILRELEQTAQQGYVPRVALANAQTAAGDIGSALNWLDQGVAEKDGWIFLSYIRAFATIRRFADQPRYWALLDQINLPALPVEHPFYELEQKMRFHKTVGDTP